MRWGTGRGEVGGGGARWGTGKEVRWGDREGVRWGEGGQG